MRIETPLIDTDCVAAQEAKQLGIASHDAIVLAFSNKRVEANIQAMHAALRERREYYSITGWQYYKPVSTNHEPYWTYYPDDDAEVRIYDQETQS